MASNAADDFENDWTFVDRDGKVDIEPRKNSVSYSKSPSTRDEVLVPPSEEVPAKDDSDGEAEFEVLSGFHCQPPPEADLESTQETDSVRFEIDELHTNRDNRDGEAEDEIVPIQQSSCQCAADDGIMIISNHFCLNEEADSAGGITVDEPLTSECDHTEDQENLPSSDISSLDGWRELPLLSESGSFSFPSVSNSSEEDNDFEPIPEEDISQDFVDLSHEADPFEEMMESGCSVFSFDSDLFNPSDPDEDVDNEEEHSDIADVSKVSDADQDIEKEVEIKEQSVVSKDGSSFYVDVSTLFVLLGVTTALGFSIGYGLSVYISSQTLEVSRSIKRPGPKTASLPVNYDPMEPLDEVSRDFLEQLALWKLEDHLDPHEQREQEPENELGDLFDTKALHQKLQQKHFKLMSLHESVKQRLRMSKVMSWYWRLKYEEERSKKGGDGEWNKALQEQLEHMEQLYLHEKHTADLWRRMNENSKLRRAVAGGIKFDKYWKDFLNRWKKVEERSPVTNETQKSPEKPEVEELSPITEAKIPESTAQNSERMRDSSWREFRNRWTKDSQVKGRAGESSSKSEKCPSGKPDNRKDLSVLSGERSVTSVSQQTNLSPLLSPVFVESGAADTSVGGSDTVTANPEREEARRSVPVIKEIRAETTGEDISEEFRKGLRFDNPLFPRDFVSSWTHDKIPPFLKTDRREKTSRSAPAVTPKQTHLQVFGLGELKRIDKDVMGEIFAIRNAKKMKINKKCLQKSDLQRVKSYQDLVKRKCRKESTVPQKYGPLNQGKISEKQDGDANSSVQFQRQLLKQKQMLRNLTQHRGEEIRKQRIQRRELKKKEKEANLRVEEADRLLSELKQERRRIEIEKRKLRRAWKVLKREEKKFSLEKELHKKDKNRLRKFTTTLKEEKQKLKKLKGKMKKKMNELLAKELKSLKLKKKTLDAEKKKEVERLRNEISQEKDKLRKEQRAFKSLKKAARKEFKKWLRALRKMKRKEKERREAEVARQRKEAKKKWEKAERERLKKQEYESVIREQAKYDKEKRRKKGEYGETGEWKKVDESIKQDENAKWSGSERKTKEFNREDFFRQQLENVKQWLSNIHKKTLKQQQSYWGSLFAQSIFNAYGGKAGSSEPSEDEREELTEKELKRERNSEREKENTRKSDENGENPGQSAWEDQKKEIRKLMWGIQKRDCDRKEGEKWEMSVRKSELTKTSQDRALAGFENLTFDVDLVKTLLKGLDKVEHEDKTASDDFKAAETNAFIIVSKESTDFGSDVKKKRSPEKPKRPDGHWWMIQVPIESEDSRLKAEGRGQQETPEGPIPPEGIRLTPEEWYEKRSKVKNRGKKVVPQGPNLFGDVRRVHSDQENTRKRSQRHNTEGRVCTSEDSEKDSIPPPDWVFQRARERAKDRGDQRSVPWYDLRAQDRQSRRSVDKHNTQFPYGKNWKHRADQRSVPWYDLRAQDRYSQRTSDKHGTQFPCGKNWKRRADQRSAPWYDQRAQDRHFQRSSDKHDTQFPCGRKRKRNQDWFFERASDRAFQRLNHVPWYSRRAEGRESQRREGLDPWNYREHMRDWMPQGPSMDERP